jgi:hypothetical protein
MISDPDIFRAAKDKPVLEEAEYVPRKYLYGAV